MADIKGEWLASKLERSLDAVVRATFVNFSLALAYVLCLLLQEKIPLGFSEVDINAGRSWLIAAGIWTFYLAGSLALLKIARSVSATIDRVDDVEIVRTSLTLHRWLMNPFARKGRSGEGFARSLDRNMGITLMILLHNFDMFVAIHALGGGHGPLVWSLRIASFVVFFLLGSLATRSINDISKHLDLDRLDGPDGWLRTMSPFDWRVPAGTNAWRVRYMRAAVLVGSAVLLALFVAFAGVTLPVA